MYQISRDLPSVSLNFLRQVQKYWVVNEFHELINIASCGLHTIHNAFVVEAMNWNIKNIFQESYQILELVLKVYFRHGLPPQVQCKTVLLMFDRAFLLLHHRIYKQIKVLLNYILYLTGVC